MEAPICSLCPLQQLVGIKIPQPATSLSPTVSINHHRFSRLKTIAAITPRRFSSKVIVSRPNIIPFYLHQMLIWTRHKVVTPIIIITRTFQAQPSRPIIRTVSLEQSSCYKTKQIHLQYSSSNQQPLWSKIQPMSMIWVTIQVLRKILMSDNSRLNKRRIKSCNNQLRHQQDIDSLT